jgi:predicted RNase H-like HicB family nuclease
MEFQLMAKFRADHYLIAEFEQIPDTKKTGEKVLAALKELPELKDLAIVSKRMEGKSWSEILGRIDVPAGSKAFWAMIKKDFSEREPYHLFIRFDMNAEGETIDDARSNVKAWVEENVVPKIEANTSVKAIKVLQPNEIFMPKLD